VQTQTVNGIKLYRSMLPFKQPLQLSRLTLTEREVLYIQWHLDDRTFLSEVAPLPEFSKETLADCINQLSQGFSLAKTRPSNTLSSIQLAFEQIGAPCFPSVQMGIARTAFQSTPPDSPHPNVCPLLTETDFDPESQLNASRLKELSTAHFVKLKVAQGNLDQDITRINALCAQPEFQASLRLDANQRWTPADIQTLCQYVDTERVQCFEEPFKSHTEYQNWAEFSAIPFVYDESLYQSLETPKVYNGLAGFILKPMLLGEERTLHLSRMANEMHYRTVISSSFETPIGLNTLRQLALKMAPCEYHGLDTLRYFDDRVIHRKRDWQPKLGDLTLISEWNFS